MCQALSQEDRKGWMEILEGREPVRLSHTTHNTHVHCTLYINTGGHMCIFMYIFIHTCVHTHNTHDDDFLLPNRSTLLSKLLRVRISESTHTWMADRLCIHSVLMRAD